MVKKNGAKGPETGELTKDTSSWLQWWNLAEVFRDLGGSWCLRLARCRLLKSWCLWKRDHHDGPGNFTARTHATLTNFTACIDSTQKSFRIQGDFSRTVWTTLPMHESSPPTVAVIYESKKYRSWARETSQCQDIPLKLGECKALWGELERVSASSLLPWRWSLNPMSI